MSEIPRSQEADAGEKTMESLFPKGWDDPNSEYNNPTPEAAEGEATEEIPEAEESELEQSTEPETAQEAALGKMSYNDFLKAAGVELEAGYRDVYIPVDGEEVPMSKLVDDVKETRKANEALLRERQELREKVKASAASVPQGQTSPEAQALMAQAAIYRNQLQAIMQAEQNDPNLVENAQVISQKFNLDKAVRDLEHQAAMKQADHERGLQDKIQKAIEERDIQARARIKEWADPTVLQTEWTQVSDILKSYGIQNTDRNQFGPNVQEMLRDFMRLKVQAKRIEDGPMRIRKVGKMLGASSRVHQGTPKPNRREVAQKIRETTNPDERLRLMLNSDLG